MKKEINQEAPVEEKSNKDEDKTLGCLDQDSNTSCLGPLASQDDNTEEGASKGSKEQSDKHHDLANSLSNGDSNKSADESCPDTVSFVTKRTEQKDSFYYVCISLVWALSLTTRLYRIAQPPKVW